MTMQFQDIVERYAIDNRFSGVVRIKQNEMTVYEGAFGYASKPFKSPNRMDVRFANASVTKMFTALGVLKLVEKGLLSLDDKVVSFILWDDTTLDPEMTVSHLLTHTSGIADYFDQDDPDGSENLWHEIPNQYMDSLQKMLPLFIDETPHFKPGERFSYSGAGYILLGLIIERVSGQDYYAYIREHVFQAHYLMDTDFIPMHHVAENVAEGYIPVKDSGGRITGWKRNTFAVPAFGLSDGGAFTTAKDMIKFLRAIRNYEVLGPEFTNLWLTPQVSVDGAWHYGYGMWFHMAEDGSVIKYGHTGEDPGVSACVYHYPKEDIDLVLFSNHGFSTTELLSELEQEILNLK